MKKLLFSVSVFKMFSDLFTNVFIDLNKYIICEFHLPRGLKHCNFLVISGGSRAISKQSNCPTIIANF